MKILSAVLSFFSSRLSRVSVSTKKFEPRIDGLRFVALASVVMHHMLGIISVRTYGSWEPDKFDHWPFNWMVRGHFGVPLFFAISGFILAMPFAGHYLNGSSVQSLRGYYGRRLERLELPYVFNLIVMFVIGIAMGHLFLTHDLGHMLASVFYLHGPIYGTQSTINGVVWSLGVEAQFYLVAPFLCMCIFQIRSVVVRRCALLALILSASVAVEALMPSGDRWNGDGWRMSLLNYSQYFLAGFLVLDYYIVDWKGADSNRSYQWDLVGLVAWSWIWSSVEKGSGYQVLLPLSVVIAYMSAFKGIIFSRIFSTKWIYTIGGMCYTVYLWHQIILMTWGKVGMSRTWINHAPLGVNVAVQCLIGAAVLAPICIVLFVLIERPCMKSGWWKKLLHIKQKSTPRIEGGQTEGQDLKPVTT